MAAYYVLQLTITQYSRVTDQYNSVNHEDQFLVSMLC